MSFVLKKESVSVSVMAIKTIFCRARDCARARILLYSFPISKKKTSNFRYLSMNKSLATTYSPTLLCAVPSAMKGLTSEFGMGSGISPSLMPPSKSLSQKFLDNLTNIKQRLRSYNRTLTNNSRLVFLYLCFHSLS